MKYTKFFELVGYIYQDIDKFMEDHDINTYSVSARHDNGYVALEITEEFEGRFTPEHYEKLNAFYDEYAVFMRSLMERYGIEILC